MTETIVDDGMAGLIDGVVGLESLVTERLEAEITTLAAHLTAAMCRWLLLIGEYDRRCAYEQWECLTMAQWLVVHVGISPSTARQHVVVAKKLLELPSIREAFSRGEVSYSRVRAVCRVANPVDEQRWLELARNATGSQIDRIVTDTIRVTNAAQPDIAQRHEHARKLTWWIDEDGMYRVTAVLPPDVGALLTNLVHAHTDTGRENIDAYEQRHADAFAQVLARASLGDEGCDSCDVPATPAVLVVVHRYPDSTATLENGPPIPRSLADRLGEHADEITATHSADSIRYGRKRKRRRTPTTTMRRFIEHRDECCRFPGCGQKKNLHAHHVRFYGTPNHHPAPDTSQHNKRDSAETTQPVRLTSRPVRVDDRCRARPGDSKWRVGRATRRGRPTSRCWR